LLVCDSQSWCDGQSVDDDQSAFLAPLWKPVNMWWPVQVWWPVRRWRIVICDSRSDLKPVRFVMTIHSLWLDKYGKYMLVRDGWSICDISQQVRVCTVKLQNINACVLFIVKSFIFNLEQTTQSFDITRFYKKRECISIQSSYY
jgi:hypothetical protein